MQPSDEQSVSAMSERSEMQRARLAHQIGRLLAQAWLRDCGLGATESATKVSGGDVDPNTDLSSHAGQ
jgi:hypothetical protein